MADRKRRVRRQRREESEVTEVEEPVEEEEVEEESEPEEVKVSPKRRSRRGASEPEDEDDAGDEDEVVEKPSAARRSRRKARKVVIADSKVVEPEPEPEDEDDEEESEPFDLEELPDEEESEDDGDDETYTIGMVTETHPIIQVLESLRLGELLSIVRTGNNSWVLSTTQAKNNKPLARSVGLLTGRAFEEEVMTKEFLEWRYEWQKLSTDEKLAAAKKAKLKWEESDSDTINVMRIGMAMKEHLGIEKYKPEYQTRSSRDRVQGK